MSVSRAANHKRICASISKNSIPEPLDPSNNKVIDAICTKVLNFPRVETGILTLISARNSRRPDTINSLERINKHGTTSTFLNFTNINNTVPTSTLSAIGSNILPNPEMILNFLAMNPSTKSDMLAIANKRALILCAKTKLSK